MIELIKKIAQKQNENRLLAITNYLDDIGVKYEFQCKEDIKNLIVKINGGNGKKTLVGAHYDVVPGSTGCNDNASSCAVLLKLIEKYKDSDQNIEFIFFDEEENGLRGSKLYTQSMNPAEVTCFINLDVVGAGIHPLCYLYGFESNPLSKVFLDEKLMNDNNAREISILVACDWCSFSGLCPTISICAGNEEEYLFFNEKTTKCPPIMYTMHNQINDNIDCINEEGVNNVLNYVADALEEISKSCN